MVHSSTPAPAPAVPISTTPRNTHIPSFGLQRVWACHQGSYQAFEQKIVHRRTVTLSLAGALLGLNFGDRSAGAARRPPPPPPPPEEKKDPNVGGVTAKVLASKKRKEAMKESMAKLRERGKPIKEPSE